MAAGLAPAKRKSAKEEEILFWRFFPFYAVFEDGAERQRRRQKPMERGAAAWESVCGLIEKIIESSAINRFFSIKYDKSQ
ncbi:hypothetical protein [Acidaminobacterium chupaoyuni]